MASRRKLKAVRGISAPPQVDTIERYVLRVELAWRRKPTLRLGELITLAQRDCLAPQYELDDDALVEAIEAYAEGRR